jgi:hypothetical protein
LLENKCSKCGLGPEWNGEPLTIQLDHIDGNRKNFNLTNLRMLCPNCHTQTETYGSKRSKVKIKCLFCECIIYKKSITKLCKKCFNKAINDIDFNKMLNNKGIKVKLCKRIMNITKDELQKFANEKSLVEIGKIFGISDNAVKKRCKKWGIIWKNKRKNILKDISSIQSSQ